MGSTLAPPQSSDPRNSNHSRRKQQAKAQLQKRRQLLINSPKPPRQSDIALDGKSICDAQNAYRKGREELSEAWNLKYQELPDAVSTAWDLLHYAEGDPEISLRARTPTVNDLPADPTEIENGLADPEYQKFQRYSAAVLQQLERLEANLACTQSAGRLARATQGLVARRDRRK